jgi:hypothetical protein
MVVCEREAGRRGFVRLWKVVNAAGPWGLSADSAAREAKRTADYAAWKATWPPETRANMEAAAAAIREMTAICPPPWRTMPEWQREARRRRTAKDVEKAVNPARVVALLEARGLVLRSKAWNEHVGIDVGYEQDAGTAALTDEGRAIGERELAALTAASQPA